MAEEKLRYSDEELKEFEQLIADKLDRARKELNFIKETLSRRNDSGTDNTAGTLKLLEDGADTAEKKASHSLLQGNKNLFSNLKMPWPELKTELMVFV